MHFTLISPRIALQKGDFLGSGIPYWPLELAILASHLRQTGDHVYLIDQFGSDPLQLTEVEDTYLQGVALDACLDSEDVIRTNCFIFFAISYMSHFDLLSSVRLVKTRFPLIPLVILENTQAVTGYSLQRVAQDFFCAGSSFLICGEPYSNWNEIKEFICGNGGVVAPANVIISESSVEPIRNPLRKAQSRPVPDWSLFNLAAYWRLPYSHGPKTSRFLPIFTSWGCPYPCDFCVIPETSNRQWYGHSPNQVVDEIITLRDRFGVKDFQIEDLNPTVQHKRWEEICELLIERQADIRFAFVSGTKAETLQLEKIPLFARAGCRYISISPESGSADLMRKIGKKFNYQHGVNLVRQCRASGIRTQACFLVGHPDESEQDIANSKAYIRELMQNGLDEIAVFIVAPFPGSNLYNKNRISISDISILTSFSPKGRTKYDIMERRRKTLLRVFFIEKFKRITDLLGQSIRAFIGVPQTKMENLPRRIVYIWWLITCYKIRKLFGENI